MFIVHTSKGKSYTLYLQWFLNDLTHQDIKAMFGTNQVRKLHVVIKLCITEFTVVPGILPSHLDFSDIFQPYTVVRRNTTHCRSFSCENECHYVSFSPVMSQQNTVSAGKIFVSWIPLQAITAGSNTVDHTGSPYT